MSRYVPIFQENTKNPPLECEEIVDRNGELRIVLADGAGARVSLSFDSYLAYRKIDEGDALQSVAQMGRTGGLAKWFYVVEDSDFVRWFNEENSGIRANQSLVHYALAAMNDIVDVIALSPPTLAVLPSQ